MWIRTLVIINSQTQHYCIGIATTRFTRRVHDRHQIVEEPCEGNLSCTVLKTSRVGDCPAEFNSRYTWKADFGFIPV